MMFVSPFELSDMADLPITRLPARTHDYYEPHYFRALLQNGPAWTLRMNDRVMILAGVAYDTDRIGWIWSFLARDSGPYMLPITRAVLRCIETLPRPMRASADHTFLPSCRWLAILGFKPCDDPAWPPGPDDLFELT